MDDYKKLSEELSFFVDEIEKDKNKKEIKKRLEDMKNSSKKIGGAVFEEFSALEDIVSSFLEDKIKKEKVIEECVRLKNELWEL